MTPLPDCFAPTTPSQHWANITRPAEQRREFPVVVIGCGEAGRPAGSKLKQAGVPFTIFEKPASVGGTWQADR